MRVWGWVTLVAALALGQAAEAQVLPRTGTVLLTTDSTGELLNGVDYTIPSDGVTYRWDFWTDSAHPDAFIYLEAPNDIFSVGEVSNGDGTIRFDASLPNPIYSMQGSAEPGHTWLLVQAQRSFSDCSGTTPADVLCSASYNVWGDNAWLRVSVADAVNITFSSVAIPEPAAWLLMTAGVFGVGLALRQRRRTLRLAAPALA